MKRSRLLLRSVLDGAVRTVLLFVLSEFSVSALLTSWNLDIYSFPLVLCVLFALFGAILSFFLMSGLSSGKHLVLFWLSSLCLFLLGCGLLFFNKMRIKISLFPIRALGVGDGLTLIFTSAIFFFGSEILRVICLVVLFLRRKASRSS